MDCFITVKGLVQGIGFRPFVAGLADSLMLKGYVKNVSGIVNIRVRGSDEDVLKFIASLKNDHKKAVIEEITVDEPLLSDTFEFEEEFLIVESDEEDKKEEGIPSIPIDMPTCGDCERELFAPSNRRYRHGMISCTLCGPRYSVIKKLPYDRQRVTFGEFSMCRECRQEYISKRGRRRHAQTIACRQCGPRLYFVPANSWGLEKGENNHLLSDDECIEKSIELLKEGGILALKDIGGFHLCCTAGSEDTAKSLRRLKGRESKPFAVMFNSVESIKKYCYVTDFEEEQLQSPARPIVLLKKKDNMDFASGVCNESPFVGAMLPSNPLQLLLSKEFETLIMTSANTSSQMIITDEKEMTEWLHEKSELQGEENIPLAALFHNRKILTPLDDSIVKCVGTRRQVIRRARGMVPEKIETDIKGDILALGGDLKATFSFAKNNTVISSQNMADLGDYDCERLFKREINRVRELFGFKEKIIVADKHPGYVSANLFSFTEKEGGRQLVRVQHHKAHVASVMAEHGLSGNVIGVAFDGTGYGDDGTIWGSEIFFVKDLTKGDGSFKRVAHLESINLSAGDEGAKNTDYSCYGYLIANSLLNHIEGEVFNHLSSDKARRLEKVWAAGVGRVQSSSMGRLFDAVSALLDICHYNSYEGEAPVKLEYQAMKGNTENMPKDCVIDIVMENDMLTGHTKRLFEALITGMAQGVDKACLSAWFIEAVAVYTVKLVVKIIENLNIDSVDNTIADVGTVDGISNICKRKNIRKEISVVLSGGTFLNGVLLKRVLELFEKESLKVYINELVPPGDGGLSLGQAYMIGNYNYSVPL